LESPGESFAASVMARAADSCGGPAFWKPAALLAAMAASAILMNAIPLDVTLNLAAGAAAAVCDLTAKSVSAVATILSAGIESAAALAARRCDDSLGILTAHSAPLAALAAALAALAFARHDAARAGRARG
ncbi:MAG: hypothetical protein N3A38_10570, partial [Planctomycetota bacterium]|nr:hypothetical protein [Planctomycetota bacterium]